MNLALFQWIAAGYAPHPWLLPLACAIALGGAWVTASLMGWAAWQHPSERGYVIAALMVSAATTPIAHAIAGLLNAPRPFMLGLSPAYIAHGARGSLPSTHAAVMFTVALIFLLRPRLRVVGFAMAAAAAATGWARVYVGVHFPLDIAAGLLVALAVGAVFSVVQWLGRRCITPFIARDDCREGPLATEPETAGHSRGNSP